MQFKWGFPGGVGGIAVHSALPPRPFCFQCGFILMQFTFVPSIFTVLGWDHEEEVAVAYRVKVLLQSKELRHHWGEPAACPHKKKPTTQKGKNIFGLFFLFCLSRRLMSGSISGGRALTGPRAGLGAAALCPLQWQWTLAVAPRRGSGAAGVCAAGGGGGDPVL